MERELHKRLNSNTHINGIRLADEDATLSTYLRGVLASDKSMLTDESVYYFTCEHVQSAGHPRRIAA